MSQRWDAIASPVWETGSSSNESRCDRSVQSSSIQWAVTPMYARIILDVHPSNVRETLPGASYQSNNESSSYQGYICRTHLELLVKLGLDLSCTRHGRLSELGAVGDVLRFELGADRCGAENHLSECPMVNGAECLSCPKNQCSIVLLERWR